MDEILRFSGTLAWDAEIDQWIADQDHDLGLIALEWFSQLRERGDDVRELMHDTHPVACVDDAPFAYVNVFTSHANLGSFLGAELDDPAGLLEGTGKRMRHVKLRHDVEPERQLLAELIEAAYADIKTRL